MKRKIPSRAGFTLRELTIAMAMGSTIMMAAVGVVHSAFDWSKTARHRRHDDQVFFNLARTLRRDITMAKQSTVSDERLELETDSGVKVVYQINENSLERTSTSDSPSEDQSASPNERYRWKRPRWASFDASDDEAAGEQIRLTLKTAMPFEPKGTPIWRSVRATTGLRLRLQAGDIQ